MNNSIYLLDFGITVKVGHSKRVGARIKTLEREFNAPCLNFFIVETPFAREVERAVKSSFLSILEPHKTIKTECFKVGSFDLIKNYISNELAQLKLFDCDGDDSYEYLPLEVYIAKHHHNNQAHFAVTQDTTPQQVTQWISKRFIVVDGALYSPRRALLAGKVEELGEKL